MISNRPHKTMQTFRSHHKVLQYQDSENIFPMKMLTSYKTMQIGTQTKNVIKQRKINKTISLQNRIKYNEQKLINDLSESNRKNTMTDLKIRKLSHKRASSLSSRTFFPGTFQEKQDVLSMQTNILSPYLLRKMQIAKEKLKQKKKILIIQPSQNFSQRQKKPAFKNFIKIAHGIRIDNEHLKGHSYVERKSPRLNLSSHTSYRARAFEKLGFTVKYNCTKSPKKTLVAKKKDFLRPWSGVKSILLGNNQQPQNCQFNDNFS